MPPETKYLTQEEVAEMLGVTIHTIRKWRGDGLIGFFRVGKTVRITEEEVLAFLDRHTYRRIDATVA